jgi:hypothetical protein
MIWMIAFPLFYLTVMLLHVIILSKPLEEAKKTIVKMKGYTGIEIALSILAFIANLVSMILSINGAFFYRNINFGIIPITVFSVMTFFFHNGIYWSIVSMLSNWNTRDQALQNAGLQNPLLQPPIP